MEDVEMKDAPLEEVGPDEIVQSSAASSPSQAPDPSAQPGSGNHEHSWTRMRRGAISGPSFAEMQALDQRGDVYPKKE